MQSLRPGEQFPIRRQLDDPLDTGTYYVRAVLRWADDDSIITIGGLNYANMTDGGSQRFYKTIDVPADKNGGQGSWLIITTTVYTDSGYTTVSDTYGIKEVQYLVFDRRNPYQGMGGGGGGLTSEQIRKIVREELAKRKPLLTMPDMQPMVKMLESLQSAVAGIEMPEPEKVNLTPLMDRANSAAKTLSAMQGDIASLRTEKKFLHDVVQNLHETVVAIDPAGYRKKMDELFDRIKAFFRGDVEEIKEGIESVQSVFRNMLTLMSSMAKKSLEKDDDDEE